MNDQWYCVRCIFDWGPSRRIDGTRTYEERLVLIQAGSFDEAIAKAEAEARSYEHEQISYTGFAQAYLLTQECVEDGFHDGTEVFSLLRDSELTQDDYLCRFFDTGEERQ